MFLLFFLLRERVSIDRILGVSPNTKSQYLRSLKWTKKVFVCFDKSKTISIDRVNDGYCDCPDGSDEPGTNACGTGVFYCRNRGSIPKEIPKWMVGDGVCDCCDGSDEANNTHANCEDVCGSIAKKTQTFRQNLSNLTTHGAKLRAKYSERGRLELSVRRKQYQFVQDAKIKILRAAALVEQIHWEIINEEDSEISMVSLRNTMAELEHTFDENFKTEMNLRKGGRKIKEKENHRGRFNLKKRAKRFFNVETCIIQLPDFSAVFERMENAYELCKEFYEAFKRGVDPEQSDSKFNKLTSLTVKLENQTAKIADRMALDFGPDKEFLPLYKQWYYFEKDDYYIEFFPYCNCTKREQRSGKLILNMGHYNSSKPFRWRFTEGDFCRRDRHSLEVRLHCRMKDEILNYHEFEGCYSRLDFGTPGACTPDYLRRVNQMNAETLDEWARDSGLY
jgi:hypothetical protein